MECLLQNHFGKTWGRMLGQTDGHRAVEKVRTLPKDSNAYKTNENRLKDFYELDNEQFDFVIKYGMEPDVSLLSAPEAKLVMRQSDMIHKQFGAIGSMKTAGVTSDAMMINFLIKNKLNLI